MTDMLLFATEMPAEQRTALVGDAEPLAAFGVISGSIAEFMIEHVR
jgi:hypothetical protein